MMLKKKTMNMPTATVQTYVQYQAFPSRAGGTEQYLQERVFCAFRPLLGGKEGSNKSTVSLIYRIYFLYPWDCICFQVTFRAWSPPPLPHSQPGPPERAGAQDRVTSGTTATTSDQNTSLPLFFSMR